MAYDYNADEVFEMAIRIEENGAAFYRRAAELQDDPSDKKFLETLAAMEDRHKVNFEALRQEISEFEKTETVFDPQEELSLYLEAMADSHGGEGDPDVAGRLTRDDSIEDIVKLAIMLEKESILFYLGLKDLVPPKLGQDKIDDIIREEQKHIIQLNGFLKKAQKS